VPGGGGGGGGGHRCRLGQRGSPHGGSLAPDQNLARVLLVPSPGGGSPLRVVSARGRGWARRGLAPQGGAGWLHRCGRSTGGFLPGAHGSRITAKKWTLAVRAGSEPRTFYVVPFRVVPVPLPCSTAMRGGAGTNRDCGEAMATMNRSDRSRLRKGKNRGRKGQTNRCREPPVACPACGPRRCGAERCAVGDCSPSSL